MLILIFVLIPTFVLKMRTLKLTDVKLLAPSHTASKQCGQLRTSDSKPHLLLSSPDARLARTEPGTFHAKTTVPSAHLSSISLVTLLFLS